jgi:carboxyl-terminal processing protease
VAKYYSPSGKALQDTGVTPSVPLVEVEGGADPDDDPSAEPQPPPQPKSSEDLLLKKAIETLNSGKAVALLSIPVPAAASRIRNN